MQEPENEYDDIADNLADLVEAADAAAHSHAPGAGEFKRLSQDTHGRLASDLPCAGCDYNLRGLLPEDRCPECGLGVRESLKSDHLRLADLAWLRKVKRGLLWLIIATLGGFTLAMSGGAFEAIFATSRNTPLGSTSTSPFAPSPQPLPVAIAYAIITLLSAGAMLYAYWNITEPEPIAVKPSTARAITRWAAIPGYSLSIIAGLLHLVPIELMLMLATGLEFVSGLAALIVFPAMMIYLRSLALRLPSRSLAKQTNIVLWGMICTVLAIIPLVVILALITMSNSQTPSGIAMVGLLLCPVGLSMLVFGIWWIALMFVYHSRIGNVINRIHRDRRATRLDAEDASHAIEG